MKTNSIEHLESRIAPASVAIAGHTATWTDFDGDLVTLKFSSAAAPDFASTDNGAGLLVDRITFDPAKHTNGAFSLSVRAAGGGDGHIDLGRVEAPGVALKSWNSPAATIAEFDCAGVDTFVSGALGAVPYSKFNNTGGDGKSEVLGDVKTFTVRGDIAATVLTIDGSFAGKIVVKGSLLGGSPGGLPDSGKLSIKSGVVGSVLVGGDLIGGDAGGRLSLPNVTNQTIIMVKGSVIGGDGGFSGGVDAMNAKLITVGGDVIGGTAAVSGVVAGGTCGKLVVGGSVIGGKLDHTGYLRFGNIGSIVVGGSVIGGFDTEATANEIVGGIRVAGSVKSVTIGGSLVGGTYGSGTKLSYNGAVSVSGNLGSLTVKGSIVGHDGEQAIVAVGGKPPVAAGDYNVIGKVIVRGDVSYAYIAAGQGQNNGDFLDRIGLAENPDAGIGSVRVGGDWFHSSLTAGINDMNTNGAQSSDTRDVGDPARRAIIGPVAIKGFVLDNPGAIGFSGFIAEKIASIAVHGVTVFKTGDAARSLDTHGFVDVAEI